MPRYQPPPDCYTATQTLEILNVSPAMLANYVKDGKIKHVVPDGRKQGFYLKKDVERVARSRRAPLRLKEETEPITFTVATIKDIPACIALNRELFTASTSIDSTTLSQKWTKWLQKNPEIIHVLKRNEEVIGITTVLPIRPGSEQFQEALRGDISFLLGDVNISAEDIEEYRSGNHIQLYIAEIGIKQSLKKGLKRKCGAKLLSRFTDTIVDLGRKGVIVEDIVAVGATKSGVKLLQHFGFVEVAFSRPDTRLFTIDMKESKAHTARDYREALKESSIEE